MEGRSHLPWGRWLCKEMIGFVMKRKLCLISEFSPYGPASYMLLKPDRKGLTFEWHISKLGKGRFFVCSPLIKWWDRTIAELKFLTKWFSHFQFHHCNQAFIGCLKRLVFSVHHTYLTLITTASSFCQMGDFYCLLKPLNPDLSPVEEGLMLLTGDSCAASGYRLTFITPAQRFTFLKATFWLPTFKNG